MEAGAAQGRTPIFQGLEVQRRVGVACRASSDLHTALRPVPSSLPPLCRAFVAAHADAMNIWIRRAEHFAEDFGRVARERLLLG
jgi:hypothetical protein